MQISSALFRGEWASRFHTKNMFVYECGDDIVLVDCGMGFPTEMFYGVDMVIPDISYLDDKRDKIRGI